MPGSDNKRNAKILNDNRAKATFFFPVIDLTINPVIYQEIEKAGHQIGMHGWNHESFANFTDFAWARELYRRQVEAYTTTLGHKPIFIRFPFGAVGDSQHQKWAKDILFEFGLIAVGWNKTFGDSGVWSSPADLADFEKKTTDNLISGDIVLGHCRVGVTRSLLSEHISKLRDQKIESVTLTQLLALR